MVLSDYMLDILFVIKGRDGVVSASWLKLKSVSGFLLLIFRGNVVYSGGSGDSSAAVDYHTFSVLNLFGHQVDFGV